MITPDQIDQLAKEFKIDRFSVFREYLQLIFLSYLYGEKESSKIYFKGGIAIHLLMGSLRFSEDLDFSTVLSTKVIKQILDKIQANLMRELGNVKIVLLYSGKNGLRFRLKYSTPTFKYPFVVRLDFAKEKISEKALISPLVTKFPIVFFPLISHLSPEEIMAEKIRAVLIRGKGRDFFDLWYLLAKKIVINKRLVEKKLKEIGKKFNKKALDRKIQEYSDKSLEKELNQFLPTPQRKIIKLLKKEILAII